RRRAPLEAPLGEEPADAPIVADSGATASPSAPPPVSDAEEQPVEVAAALEAFQVQAAALEANAILEQSDEEVEAAVASIQPVELVPEADRSVVVLRFPDNSMTSVPAPEELAALAEGRAESPGPRVVIPREVVKSPVRLWATAWTRPAGALAAAAGLT